MPRGGPAATLMIAARDEPAAKRHRAEIVCDGKADVALLTRAIDGNFSDARSRP